MLCDLGSLGGVRLPRCCRARLLEWRAGWWLASRGPRRSTQSGGWRLMSQVGEQLMQRRCCGASLRSPTLPAPAAGLSWCLSA